MNHFLGGFAGEIVIAILFGLGGIYYRAHKLWLLNIFNAKANEEAKLLSGTWEAMETFTDSSGTASAKYILELKCRGAEVRGTQTYRTGRAEKEGTYDLEGSFEKLVMNVTWKKRNSIETGTASLMLSGDKKLVGHGLYAFDQKVYTSVFTAKKT